MKKVNWAVVAAVIVVILFVATVVSPMIFAARHNPTPTPACQAIGSSGLNLPSGLIVKVNQEKSTVLLIDNNVQIREQPLPLENQPTKLYKTQLIENGKVKQEGWTVTVRKEGNAFCAEEVKTP